MCNPRRAHSARGQGVSDLTSSVTSDGAPADREALVIERHRMKGCVSFQTQWLEYMGPAHSRRTPRQTRPNDVASRANLSCCTETNASWPQGGLFRDFRLKLSLRGNEKIRAGPVREIGFSRQSRRVAEHGTSRGLGGCLFIDLSRAQGSRLSAVIQSDTASLPELHDRDDVNSWEIEQIE